MEVVDLVQEVQVALAVVVQVDLLEMELQVQLTLVAVVEQVERYNQDVVERLLQVVLV